MEEEGATSSTVAASKAATRRHSSITAAAKDTATSVDTRTKPATAMETTGRHIAAELVFTTAVFQAAQMRS